MLKKLSILIASIVLLFGCSIVAAQAHVYRLGGMYTLKYHDGTYADWGNYALAAAQMAIHDINASGMLGEDTLAMPDSLVIDYKCWPEHAADEAKKLLSQGIIALTGVDCSGPAVKIAREAQEFKTPAISYGADASMLSSATNFPYFYRVVTPSAKYEGYLLDVVEHYGLKDIALFYTTEAWGIGASNVIQTAAEKSGMNIKAVYGYPRDTPLSQVTADMQAVKDSGVKTILIAMPTPDTIVAFNAISALHMNQPGYAIFASEMLSAKVTPATMDGAKGYMAPMTKLPPSEALTKFAARLSNKLGKDAKVDQNSKAFFYGVLSYDHIEAVGHAIAAAKRSGIAQVNGQQLMKYLRTVSFDGLSGPVHAAPNTNDREFMPVAIMNLHGYTKDGTTNYVPVGSVDPKSGKLTLDPTNILWPGDTKTPPAPAQ